MTPEFCPHLSFQAEPLTDAEMALKESYIAQGFPDWSRRDFQQFIRALEAYAWYRFCPLVLGLRSHLGISRSEDWEAYVSEI